eukprot:TRINITY_DN10702_c0_g1_i3.p3 TRINITY_DN10702_c0_g1~~TRINITY_DN10702_c0_g1_i3.p3  ORF type:complete len:146 (-),score=15.14 TRINITY_DN10702_c0_g1_i3:666-1103(-)
MASVAERPWKAQLGAARDESVEYCSTRECRGESQRKRLLETVEVKGQEPMLSFLEIPVADGVQNLQNRHLDGRPVCPTAAVQTITGTKQGSLECKWRSEHEWCRMLQYLQTGRESQARKWLRMLRRRQLPHQQNGLESATWCSAR